MKKPTPTKKNAAKKRPLKTPARKPAAEPARPRPQKGKPRAIVEAADPSPPVNVPKSERATTVSHEAPRKRNSKIVQFDSGIRPEPGFRPPYQEFPKPPMDGETAIYGLWKVVASAKQIGDSNRGSYKATMFFNETKVHIVGGITAFKACCQQASEWHRLDYKPDLSKKIRTRADMSEKEARDKWLDRPTTGTMPFTS